MTENDKEVFRGLTHVFLARAARSSSLAVGGKDETRTFMQRAIASNNRHLRGKRERVRFLREWRDEAPPHHFSVLRKAMLFGICSRDVGDSSSMK